MFRPANLGGRLQSASRLWVDRPFAKKTTLERQKTTAREKRSEVRNVLWLNTYEFLDIPNWSLAV
jgi:hypothetical protein